MRNDITKKVKNAIKQIEPDSDIILYGSRVRGDYNELSDWDFLILVDGIVDSSRVDRIRSVLYEIEIETDEIISSIVRNRTEWGSSKYSMLPFHSTVENEGVHI